MTEGANKSMAGGQIGDSSGQNGHLANSPESLRGHAFYASKVTTYWVHAQVAALTIASISSFAVLIALAFGRQQENEFGCLLYAGWIILGSRDLEVILKKTTTTWGSKRTCDFVEYSFGTAAIISFILIWFLMLLRPTMNHYLKRKLSKAASLVIPTAFVSLVFAILLLVCSSMLIQGIRDWCASVTKHSQFKTCASIADYSVVNQGHVSNPSFTVPLYHFIVAAILCWVAVTAWGITLVISIVRFIKHIDFPEFYFDDLEMPQNSVENSLPPDDNLPTTKLQTETSTSADPEESPSLKSIPSNESFTSALTARTATYGSFSSGD